MLLLLLKSSLILQLLEISIALLVSQHLGVFAAADLSATMILFPVSKNRHFITRRRQLAHGSSPEHLILLCRQATHLSCLSAMSLARGGSEFTRLPSFSVCKEPSSYLLP